MVVIAAVAASFVLMLAMPFAGAILYCATHEGAVLPIEQMKVKDARYFGKSFARLIEENLPYGRANEIFLSRRERYIDAQDPAADQEKVGALVICRQQDYVVPGRVRDYEKEIYARHNLYFSRERLRLRAAYADGSMYLAAGCIVSRWVDARRSLTAGGDCVLGMSASAGERMQIGAGCRFKRLYAPEIFVGECDGVTAGSYKVKMVEGVIYGEKRTNAGETPGVIEKTGMNEVMDDNNEGWSRNCKKSLEIENGKLRYVDEQYVDKWNVAEITVITSQNLTVLENIIVLGDIRSHQSVRLCDHTLICGNVFAEEDIRIGKDAVVLGNIFTQGDIVVERGASLGQPGEIHSMVARGSILLAEGVMIHGFVSCEGGGRVEEKSVKESEIAI